MNLNFWPDALGEYFAGLLRWEDRLPVIAPWGRNPVFEMLRWHKVEPLARELHLSGPCPLPAFQALFQADRFRQLFKDEVVQDQLQEIAKAFQAGHLEFLILKGPLWAEQIYPSALYRHLGDIDLLVKPEARDLAINLLFNLGYVLHAGVTEEEYLRRGEVVFEYPRENWRGQTIVELHWHPINADKITAYHRRRRLAVELEDFFGLAKPAPFRTFSLLLPRPEVCFGYQLVHGICQHQLHRLLPLVDLASILRSHPQLDFPLLVELMRKWQALIPFFLGLKALWLLGLKEGPQNEFLERLEKVMPWHIRSFMAAVSPKQFLLSYAGKGHLMRTIMRLVATEPLDVMI